jgi:hypothetical protein
MPSPSSLTRSSPRSEPGSRHTPRVEQFAAPTPHQEAAANGIRTLLTGLRDTAQADALDVVVLGSALGREGASSHSGLPARRRAGGASRTQYCEGPLQDAGRRTS